MSTSRPEPLRALLRAGAAAVERALFPIRSRGRHETVCLERIGGADLLILPTVMNPALFRTGPLLAREVARRVRPGTRVLDMGSGSGIVGVEAARRGARVLAVDLNPEAVRATRVNAMLNRVEILALEGDLFDPLPAGSRFDVVSFNPPFFAGPATDHAQRAFYGGESLEVVDRFLAGARAHLSPAGGAILVAGSSQGALGAMRDLYRRHRFTYRTVRTRERLSERLVIDLLGC